MDSFHDDKIFHKMPATLAFFQELFSRGRIYYYANFNFLANFSIVFGSSFRGGQKPLREQTASERHLSLPPPPCGRKVAYSSIRSKRKHTLVLFSKQELSGFKSVLACYSFSLEIFGNGQFYSGEKCG